MAQNDLSPSALWVEHPDPEYDGPCPACGALVAAESRGLHRAWHLAIEERADAYVSPPTYGGR